jgi:predicted flavoprotein YhiN
MTIDALKKGLLIACNITHHLCGVNHFVNRCPRLKHEMKAVMAPYTEVNKIHAEGKAVQDHLFFH